MNSLVHRISGEIPHIFNIFTRCNKTFINRAIRDGEEIRAAKFVLTVLCDTVHDHYWNDKSRHDFSELFVSLFEKTAQLYPNGKIPFRLLIEGIGRQKKDYWHFDAEAWNTAIADKDDAKHNELNSLQYHMLPWAVEHSILYRKMGPMAELYRKYPEIFTDDVEEDKYKYMAMMIIHSDNSILS